MSYPASVMFARAAVMTAATLSHARTAGGLLAKYRLDLAARAFHEPRSASLREVGFAGTNILINVSDRDSCV